MNLRFRFLTVILFALSTGTAHARQASPANLSERYGALLAESRNQLELGQAEKAVTFARQASRLDGSRFEAYFLSCMILFQSEDYAGARRFLQEALQRAPAGQAPTLRDFMALVDRAETLAATAETVRLLVSQASTARNGNRHALAAGKYREAWALAPERPDFALRAASSYAAIEEFAQTAAVYRELLAAGPMEEVRTRAKRALEKLRPILQADYDAQLTGALAHMERKEFEPALAGFLAAASTLPDEALPYFHGGRAHAMLGAHAKAIAALGEAIARGFLSRDEIATSPEYRSLGPNGDFQKLLEDTFGEQWAAPIFMELQFESLLVDIAKNSEEQKWPQAWELVLQAYQLENQFEKDRQMDLAPWVISVASSTAIHHRDNGDFKQAIELIGTCLKWAPEDPVHYVTRAKVHLLEEHWDLAQADYRMASQLDPTNATHILSQGLVLIWKDDRAGAQEYFADTFTNKETLWSEPWGREIELKWPYPVGSLRDIETAYDLAIQASPPSPALFNNRGLQRLARGATAEAVQDHERAAQLDSQDPWILENLAVAEHALVDSGGRGFTMEHADPEKNRLEQIDKYRNVATHYSNAAWRFATSSNRDFRNGEKAVELATLAVQFSQRTKSSHLDSLAAAHAENGEWALAVGAANRAIQLEPKGATQDRYLDRLSLYRQNRPYRDR